MTSSHPVESQHIFPILGYFGLTTLSTIGYGEITPLAHSSGKSQIASLATVKRDVTTALGEEVVSRMRPS